MTEATDRDVVASARGRSAEIDAVLAALPDEQRAALEELRQMIGVVAPAATEGISYSVPAFRYRGRPLVSFAAAKSHCALYVMSPAVVDAHRADLQGYDTSKGTIRFRPGQPLPAALVGKLVRARMRETDAGMSG